MDGRPLGLVAFEARTMSRSEARRLEHRLKAHPDDVEARARLLGRYFQSASFFPPTRRARDRHVLWFVAHRPEDPFTGSHYCSLNPGPDPATYREAKRLWEGHLNAGENPALLSRAVDFFTLTDLPLAVSLCRRWIALQPENPDAHRELAHLLELTAFRIDGESEEDCPSGSASIKERARGLDTDAAQEAYHERRKAYKLSRGSQAHQFYELTKVPEAAYEAGDFVGADSYAHDLLRMASRFRKDWNYGNALFIAHTVLGRLALRAGDMETARQHLLDSASHRGSPQLNSSGPKMDLARELLAAGERDAVIGYLERCGTFWAFGFSLNAWIREIRRTGTTEFKDHWTAYARLYLHILASLFPVRTRLHPST
jgi:hypothetical protein